MSDGEAWRGSVGASWAREYRRTDRAFGALTDRLLGASVGPGFARAVDIGCGAGELSLALARGNPASAVLGLDVSTDLVAIARRRGERLDNVTFEVADAAAAGLGERAPDLIASRHGVMFFDDPPAAFAHLRREAAPDARLVFSCFRRRDANPWATLATGLTGRTERAPRDAIDAPSPFAFADRDAVQGLLADAGWNAIGFEQADFPFVLGSGPDALDEATAFALSIGPGASIGADLPDAERPGFEQRLRERLEDHRDGSLIALRASAWIVSACA